MEPILKRSAALVTGASRGLGLCIARALVRAGASVWLTARSHTDLLAVRNELASECTDADQHIEITSIDLGHSGAPAALETGTITTLRKA